MSRPMHARFVACLALALAVPAGAAAQRGARAPDACRRVDAHARDRVAYNDPVLQHGAVYRCRLHSGGPVVRVVLAADGDGLPVAIRVYPLHPARRPLQTVAIDAVSRPLGGATPLHGVDVNRDGWTDLQVRTDDGSAGVIFDFFTFDPRTRRFIASPEMKAVANPEPVAGRACVRWIAGGGAGDYESGEMCWRGGRWVEVRRETVTSVGPARYGAGGVILIERVTRLRRDGRLRVVRVDTVRDTIR